jgi:hypothetical protein
VGHSNDDRSIAGEEFQRFRIDNFHFNLNEQPLLLPTFCISVALPNNKMGIFITTFIRESTWQLE